MNKVDKPKVSLVLTCYNLGRYVGEMIASVKAQTYKNWELIIVNDGSTDGETNKILSVLKKQNPKIELINQPNAGLSTARNNGIKISKGKYIACLDADDILHPEFLEKTVKILDADENEKLGFVTTYLREIGERVNLWETKDYNPYLLLVENAVHVSSLFRKKAWQSVAGYRVSLNKGYEDWDFWISIVERGYKWDVVKEALFYYRIREGSMLKESKQSHLEIYAAIVNNHKEYITNHLVEYAIESQKTISQLRMISLLSEQNLRREKVDLQRLLYAERERTKFYRCSKVIVLVKKLIQGKEKLERLMRKGRARIIFYRETLMVALTSRVKNTFNFIYRATKLILKLLFRVLRLLVIGLKRIIRRIVLIVLNALNIILRLPVRALKRLLPIGLKRIIRRIVLIVLNALNIILRLPVRALKRLLPIGLSKIIHRIMYREIKSDLIAMNNEKWPAERPMVSIITPFYNNGDYIYTTMNSVLNQSYQNFEYIIVDDGSTESSSIEIIQSIYHPKVRIIKQKNKGVAIARNVGINHASGKYILCLDSDDIIDRCYLEKGILVLEANPNISFVTPNMRMFGVVEKEYIYEGFNPLIMLKNNIVSTAAIFKKSSWRDVGGYKPKIGYEDWEFWVNLVKNGYWGKNIPELLFNYRTSLSSRYTEDLKNHADNINTIRKLHLDYLKKVKADVKARRKKKFYIKSDGIFSNLSKPADYRIINGQNMNILFILPWMPFGGAETLIYNFTSQIKDVYNLSFVTVLKNQNEWERKFKEISDNIYHLPNYFDSEEYYYYFIKNYIKTRNIHILHAIHVGYHFNLFKLLPLLKKEFPNLKVITSFFNSQVPLFENVFTFQKYIDNFLTDNQDVITKYKSKIPSEKSFLIKNGIDSNRFNPERYDRRSIRTELGLGMNDLGIFFAGRLSTEKKPDVFIELAKIMLSSSIKSNFKFFVIGDGPLRAIVQKAEKDSPSNFMYLGYQEEVPKYLAAADLFILPSIIEGSPLSVPEAMAMGVAVIASDVGAIKEMITDGVDGFIVKPANIEEFRAKILYLSENKALLRKIKEKARKRALKDYSLDRLGDDYKKFYKQVLER